MGNDLESDGLLAEQSFTQSAGKQLALYALYALITLGVLVYLLSLIVGRSGAATGGAIDVENNSITVAMREEPPQLDSGRATDTSSGSVLHHTMEGLLGYDYYDQLTPGVAERWEIRNDGATFWLRDDAFWSDGQPVTAHDFVFAWRHALDPETASQYAFILYPVLNAEAINNGELPVSTLGVEAVDDRTLEVKLERPTPYFDKLVAFYTYYPIREDFFLSTNGRYGSDADMLLYNGPYKMTSWIHNSSMRWEKNPYYWSDEKGFLDAIDVAYITQDVNARLNLFKDGQIADTHLVAPMLPNAMEQRWHIQRFIEGTVFYLEFNHREERITRNHNLRKAMQLAQDPTELVYKALKEASFLPGTSLFPAFIQGVNGPFREEHPPPEHRLNIAKAREHLELARQELGLEEFPPIVLLSQDSPVALVVAEYYQALYRKNLGLEIRIDAQIFKQRLAKTVAGEFDIVNAGWGPDYNDALTFGDLFASWNLNNRGRYNSQRYDELVRTAQSSLDPNTRMDAFAEMQQLIYDDVVVIPLYERGWSYVVDPRLQQMRRRSIGPEIDYSYAYIDESEQ